MSDTVTGIDEVCLFPDDAKNFSFRAGINTGRAAQAEVVVNNGVQ